MHHDVDWHPVAMDHVGKLKDQAAFSMVGVDYHAMMVKLEEGGNYDYNGEENGSSRR